MAVSTKMPLVDHVDLVVSSIERSLPFYRGLLAPLGWIAIARQEGERGETIHYLAGPDWGGSLGLRERPPESPAAAVDRYQLGLHQIAFEAPTRAAVDRAAWVREHGGVIERGPGERHYTPGYYAVFELDPDGIKLEIVHRPHPFSLSFARGMVRGAGSVAARLRRARDRRSSGSAT